MMVMVMDQMGIDAVKMAHIFATDRLFGVVACQQGLINRKKAAYVINDDPDIMRNKDDRHLLFLVEFAKKFIKALL
jgi:hypothetical protein